jgi:hypothetical protein
VLDFDETMTQGDTVGVLIEAAISAQVQSSETPDARRAGLLEVKERLVNGYAEAYAQVTSEHLPEGSLPRQTGLDMELVSGFLDDMNAFEQKMNARVVESGILAGLQVCNYCAHAKRCHLLPFL